MAWKALCSHRGANRMGSTSTGARGKEAQKQRRGGESAALGLRSPEQQAEVLGTHAHGSW